ncbi:MAG: TonB-dependent receptor [Tannerella sp.]|jgi:hypothetical protein|nr:TonB-dependent receptor [Tannerella sp.]
MERSIFFRFFFLFLILIFCIAHVDAQSTIRGTVVDENGEAVEFATVQLLSGSSDAFVGYGITDAKGAFTAKGSRTDSLRIVVSSVGYKKYEQPVKSGDVLNIKIESEAFLLDEVVVRPGRVWSGRDTINYNVSQFLSARDRTLRDVLEKFPGIAVNETGKISYQGKDISNFYIEGMDPVGGRYNQITNNLRAEAVETVQVLENHQSIKMLEDLVASEEVAINLKLKAEFQAVWMFSLEGGIGTSPLLWYSVDNAIRLSRTNQSIFSYKGNNTGIDYSTESGMMGMRRNSFMDTPSSLSFLTTPSIMAPLKKERLLFNDVHSFSANRMYKLNETMRMRLNANFTHDERRQERGSETLYFQLGDTIQVSELSKTKLFSDEAALSVQIENNAADQYLTNNFSVTGNWNKGISDYTGNPLTARQQMLNTTLGASNDFRTIWGNQAFRYELRSLLRYENQPEEVRADSINQKTLLNRFYSDNSFSVTAQKRYFVPQLNLGFTSDINNIQNNYTPYIAPSLQWNKEKWQTRFGLPVVWANYPGTDFSRLSVRPSANITYQMNYAWRFALMAGYREQYGNLLNYHDGQYYRDYRNIVRTPETLPVQQIQNYNLNGEYKKTSEEFFASLSLSYMQGTNSHINEQLSEHGYIISNPVEMSNQTTTKRIAGTISKGFYDIKLTTSLSAQYSQSEGEQLNRGEKLPFLSNRLNLEPKINWTYLRNFEANYTANISLTGSKIANMELTPLWNIVQKLQLSYVLSGFETNFTTEHYYNEVNNSTPVSHFFVDLSMRYKWNKWLFSANLNNLLNKQQYAYSEYSEIRSYSSWIHIRGREFLFGVQYKF